MKPNATVPGIGQTWRADFGSDGPWGRFVVDLTFESQTELSLVAARGDADGDRFDASYTTVEAGPGLFIVRWKEDSVGTCVTQFQDWNTGHVLASVVTKQGEFVQLLGSFVRRS
ncbi:MAG TPA: hypothetical protein VK745_03590 [Polyangiaceae bacterium]|jgi:hypothetical protein|nr:hypothetical protein [Polyangiaceae bacterium]